MESDLGRWRAELPSLQAAKGLPPIYLDNACTTLRPRSVVAAMNAYYEEHPACHRRAVHDFGRITTKKYLEARATVQRFLQARRPEEIVFNRNTTEGINFVANALDWRAGDVVLTSDFEHNSNLLPWQYLTRRKGIVHKRFAVPPHASPEQAFENFQQQLRAGKVKLVSTFHTSHITGLELPIREMARAAHEAGALFLCDAAQALLHARPDVQELDVDFLAFSFHKALGPSGMGAFYGRHALLENLEPVLVGGETVEDVDFANCVLAAVPDRFEAGLQNYAGAIGAAEALRCLEELKRGRGYTEEAEAVALLREGIAKLGRARILGSSGSIVNFYFEHIGSGDVSRILNETRRIMVRSGVMCAHAWYKQYSLPPSVRISLAPYNTVAEARTTLQVLTHIARHF